MLTFRNMVMFSGYHTHIEHRYAGASFILYLVSIMMKGIPHVAAVCTVHTSKITR